MHKLVSITAFPLTILIALTGQTSTQALQPTHAEALTYTFVYTFFPKEITAEEVSVYEKRKRKDIVKSKTANQQTSLFFFCLNFCTTYNSTPLKLLISEFYNNI